MHFEEFAEGKSYIHSLDPRIKIAGLVPFILVVALTSKLQVSLLAVIAGITLVLFSRINFIALLKRLYAVNIFILFLWLILPFTIPGRKFLALGALKASYEGIFYTLNITLKANAIILCTIALVGTTPIFRIAHALRCLKIPEKLVYLFFFSYRYITVLHEEYDSLNRAMKMRAFKPRTNLHTYKSYANLIGILLVRSYDRSQRIYQAMLCRGFKGKFPALSSFRTNKRDFAFLIFMLLFTIFLIMVETENFFRVL